MFTGLTAATLLGVPAGAWLGLHLRLARHVLGRGGDRRASRSLCWRLFVPRDAARRSAGAAARRTGGAGAAAGAAGTRDDGARLCRRVRRVHLYPAAADALTGLSESAVSPILLVFGGGLAIGNILGGRLADRGLARALLGTLAALALVLAAI